MDKFLQNIHSYYLKYFKGPASDLGGTIKTDISVHGIHVNKIITYSLYRCLFHVIFISKLSRYNIFFITKDILKY